MEETQKIQYQVGEAWKGAYNSATNYSYANVVQDPTGLSVYRSLKSGNVGHPLTDTTWWFKIIDLSSIKSESDRIAALDTAIAEAEALRVAAEEARERQAAADHATASTDHTTAGTDHTTAQSDHTTAGTDHQTASADHQQATADHTQYTTDHGKELEREQAETLREQAEARRAIAENNRVAAETERHTQYTTDHSNATSDHATAAADHATAAADHTQASNDHTASVDATAKASNVDATINGMIVTITDKNGVSTSVNIGFDITKTYASVSSMNADAANVEEGTFVMIATSDTTSTENARLYVRNSNAASSETPFTFLCDLDQAATSAWADWFNNYKPTIESDHTRAENDHTLAASDHVTAGTDHTQAGQDHTTAGTDHTQAGQDHTTSGTDHTQAGQDHTRAEIDHSQAAADHQQAGVDHTRAGQDHTTAAADHEQAGSDHTRAESDHATATSDHTQAEQDHTTATSDHATATSDHTQAEQDHTTATSDHEQAATDHTRAEEDHTASAAATEAANEAAAGANALQENLENGNVVPALAGNLESWADNNVPVENNFDTTVRTTAGDDPIDMAYGGVLASIVAKADFKCDALVTSGYNLLRLASNGGVAVAVGSGWYFPVPRLELGAFGDATKNNGVLLTDKDGNNIKNATVRFKALADGVPTSVDDGVAASYQDVTYNNETFRTYLTSGAGYLIVSGITYAGACAHLAWEDWYDKYVSPTAEDDAGDSISLTALFTAAPNGTGKFLVLGSGGNTVATRATRTSSTQMTITDPIGRVTSPSWTNELQEDEETYKHSLAISGMKSDGLAQIEGSDQVLTVVGTTVSYTDTNATAISGAVRYEKATAATANVTLSKTQYAPNDCGIEMKSGATGEAYFGCTYSQNVADALSQIAKVKLDISLSVVAEALLYLYNENKALRELLAGKDNAVLPVVKAQSVECDDILTLGVPNVLYGSVEGAPSAANVPDNWNEETMTVWNGCPRKIGQQYVDKVGGKVYYAIKVTGSTGDWVVLN